jgi:putative copper resistance protein D
MLATGLVATRFVHFGALLLLFGWSLHPLYAGGGAPRRPLAALAALALVSGAAWFFLTAAGMAGSAEDAFDPATLSAVVRQTDFGPLWLARLAVIGLSLALVLAPMRSPRAAWAPMLVASLALASLAGTGHARITGGAAGALHVASDALHLLAAGGWLGGLAALIVATRAALEDGFLRRFSGMGYIAVAALVATGLVNSWFLVGAPAALITSAYGRLLALKLTLFAAMAGLAALNRWRLTPALAADPHNARALAQLRRNVITEQLIGLAVVAVISLLGTLPPPAGG